ncbi:MAG TPA: NAD(P)-dependent oxidoreductase, partial [Novosphingobium sp.]|nr:NAD(P)-dependent oxidoreductase [Novosphingobium sp.]
MGSAPESSGARNKLRLAIVIAAVGAALWFGGKAFGWWDGASDGKLRLYGNVEIREVQLGFRVGGRIERILVDEGDKVVPGQVLAELDRRPLTDRLASAEARYESASAAAARDANGSRPQQVSEARAALVSAQAALSEARRQFERRETLAAKGFISRADLQTSEAAMSAAQARVAQAQAALSLAQEGARVEDRAASAATSEAVLAERRAVQTDLADAVIRASEPGEVLTRARETGSIVQPGQTVTLTTLEDVFAQADVITLHIPENDETRGLINRNLLSRVKKGCLLINCARAGIINENDLRAVKAEKNMLFCTDVFEADAPGPKSVADIADIMLPHLGANTFEANFNAAKRAAEQLIAYFDNGVNTYVVNKGLPDKLNESYQQLAYRIAYVARCYIGRQSPVRQVKCSFY